MTKNELLPDSVLDISHMVERFYGYGRWDAPFWFVGPEAGMSKDGSNNLQARYESWKQLGCTPVVDCETHHRGFEFTQWHQPRLPTQPTWRRLIRLLLGIYGGKSDLDDTRGVGADCRNKVWFQRDMPIRRL